MLSHTHSPVATEATVVVAVALAIAGLAAAAPNAAAQGVTGKGVTGQGVTSQYSPDRVLVRFAPGAAALARSQAREAVGADRDIEYSIVPGLERLALRPGRTADEVIAALRRNPNVLYAEPDYILRSTAVPNDPSYGSLWGMSNIGAPLAWDTTTGPADLPVAIIDSGVDVTHPDLAGNVWVNPGEGPTPNSIDDDGNGYVDDINGWDFAYNDNNPTDARRHGTHVAGTVGARGNNSLGVTGVNWQVKLVALKFIDDTGVGPTSNAILALQYANRMNFRVSNNSWGGTTFSQALYDTINALRANNHLFVAAAGNSNVDIDKTPTYPASYNLDNIVAVAAITSGNARASYSNFGKLSVDLGAPGDAIFSTVPGGTYANLSGTSMAAPHVAGAAAMITGRNPTWSYAQVREAILRTTRPLTALSTVTVTGGTLDLAKAIAWVPPPPPVAPTALTAAVASASQINLSWTDNSSNETGFQVERSTDGVTFTQIGTTGASVRTYSATGLAASTAYSFRVRAFNASGNSAYTNVAGATTLTASTTTAPAVPTLSGTASSKLATLSWTNVAGETGYRLSRATYSTTKKTCGSFALVATLGADVTSTTNAVSTAGSYCYAITSFNSVGSSAQSNRVILAIPN